MCVCLSVGERDRVEADGKAMAGESVLEEDFLAYSRKLQQVRARLCSRGLLLRYQGSSGEVSKEKRVSLSDVVGCHVMRNKRRGRSSTEEEEEAEEDPEAFVCFYCYPLRKRKFFLGACKRTREPLVLRVSCGQRFQDNLDVAVRWRRTAKHLLRSVSPLDDVCPINYVALTNADKKFLVLVNPKSGSGKALQIFRSRVYPILAEAEVGVKVFVTSRRFHAQEMLRSADLSHWKGIIVVSGDGLLFEVFNGLMERPDWVSAIHMPVGIVPGGSGNGLARAIGYSIQEPYEENPILISTLNVVKGYPTPMDLVCVETAQQRLYSFLSIGWGLMADIDIESERLRALGEPRFTLWAVARVIKLRVYQGRVSYLPAFLDTNGPPSPSPMTSPPLHQEGTLHRSYTVSLPTPNSHNETSHNTREDEANGIGHSMSYQQKALSASVESGVGGGVSGLLESGVLEEMEGSVGGSVEDLDCMGGGSRSMSRGNLALPLLPCSLPPLGQPVPDGWTVQEGEFVMVYAAYQTHLGTDVFFAPKAKLSDGIIWLLILRAGVSRSQVLQFLLGTSTGEHVQCPYVQMIPVKAFRLEPLSPTGHLTVDGELVEYGPIQAEVLPGLARVVVRRKEGVF